MNLRSGILALAALAVGAVLLATSPALAADGASVPPGAVICTDWGRAEAGVWAYGHATYRAPVTWTVRASRTADDTGVEVFRRTNWELKTASVISPDPDAGFYRTCLTNTSHLFINYRFDFGPLGQSGFAKRGMHTAVLAGGGGACDGVLSGWLNSSGRVTGVADVPVTFTARVTNGDGDVVRIETLETTTHIDRMVAASPAESYEICVTNTSAVAVTVSWNLLPA